MKILWTRENDDRLTLINEYQLFRYEERNVVVPLEPSQGKNRKSRHGNGKYLEMELMKGNI